MTSFLKSFLSNQSGATAIEYALIASIISIAAVGAMTLLGGELQNNYNNVSNKIPE
jgi:pilus assembly protein Flp/PilA